MRKYLEEKVLDNVMKHPAYAPDSQKDAFNQGYDYLANKGLLIKHQPKDKSQLCSYQISRIGIRRLKQLQNRDSKSIVISNDMTRAKAKSLTLTIMAWISFALGIGTAITTIMYNNPNQSSGFIMVGIYSLIIFLCIMFR